eukprot:c36679_g1_i1 orf=212-394(+)
MARCSEEGIPNLLTVILANRSLVSDENQAVGYMLGNQVRMNECIKLSEGCVTHRNPVQES